MEDRVAILRRAYREFNARNIDAVLEFLAPDVDWPNGMEGGREVGHDAVRAYWTRQFGLVSSNVEPESFVDDAHGRIVVEVHQVVRDLEGTLLSESVVEHVYTFENGLVRSMDIRDPAP